MGKSPIYGPVTSRRLGLSLGVDMVPYKVCSFDCIYCQIGPTKSPTVTRRNFGFGENIFKAIEQKLQAGVRADHITLGGSGEPTLNRETGDIIRGIKKMTDIPVAVLTNGSMLWDQKVRQDLLAADVVLPSLDAADEETFKKINRPHPDISFDRLLDGILSFSTEYTGKIWLEIFFIENINTSAAHVEKIKQMVQRIRPDKVHLNTAVRPPAEAFVTAVDRDALCAIAESIGGSASVIAEFKENPDAPVEEELPEQALVDMLLRRPCTINDIATALHVNPSLAVKILDRLVAKGRVTITSSGAELYYVCKEASDFSQ
ncbi:MAG: radical SAM protein [Desulfosalsimonadaceae bacterium]